MSELMVLEKGENVAVDIGAVAIKAVSRVFEAWHVGAEVQAKLLGTSDRTWSRMRSGEQARTLNQDQETRASALIGLYKGLHLYFSDSLADRWVTMQNAGPLFGGARPLDRMLEGGIPAMLSTREYVDAIRGGV